MGVMSVMGAITPITLRNSMSFVRPLRTQFDIMRSSLDTVIFLVKIDIYKGGRDNEFFYHDDRLIDNEKRCRQ